MSVFSQGPENSRSPHLHNFTQQYKGHTTRKVKGGGEVGHFVFARYFFGTIWCVRILFLLCLNVFPQHFRHAGFFFKSDDLPAQYFFCIWPTPIPSLF